MNRAERIDPPPRRMPAVAFAAPPLSEDALPVSDGNPMPDGYQQADTVWYLRGALRMHYRQRSDVSVDANMFMHYPIAPGAPEPLQYAGGTGYASLAPDCVVSFGAGRRDRLSYAIGAEPVPDFVLEVASQSTWSDDYGIKRDIYASLGISEDFIFDVCERPADPSRLLGLRLESGTYRAIERQPMPGGGDGVFSQALGLYARVKAHRELRLRDPAAGMDMRTLEEAELRGDREERRRREEARLRREEERRRRAAELRIKEAMQLRRAEELRTEAAIQRRREEQLRAAAAERKIAAMAAELARLRKER